MSPDSPGPAPPMVPRAVWLLVAVLLVLIGATQSSYALAGDEYFFLVAGAHLDWGYADQPPLVAALARVADLLSPDNRTLLRLPMVLAVLAAVVMTSLLTREFGGSRRSQVFAAAAFALSPYALVHMRWLTTDAIDMSCWTACILLLIRWVHSRRDVLWVGIAAVTALGLQNKYLIGVFWLLVVLSVLWVGPRQLLRARAPWLAGLFALVSALPSLAWQASHGWPQLMEGPAIVDDRTAYGGRLVFVLAVLAALGIVGTVLFCVGTSWLVRQRSFRFLGIVSVSLILLVGVAQMRPNYLGGIYPLGLAAGAAAMEHGGESRWWRWQAPWIGLLASTILLIPALFPVGERWLGGVGDSLLPDHRYNWTALADTVRDVYEELPGTEQGATIVIAGDYWRASVLERLRQRHGLPPVYGDMQGSWYFGPPSARTRTVIYVDQPPKALVDMCGQLRLSRSTYNDHPSFAVVERTYVPIYVCTNLRAPLPEIWPELQHTVLPPGLRSYVRGV